MPLFPPYQPLDADLSAIALLATTAYGRALLELVDAAALRAAAALGTVALLASDTDGALAANSDGRVATQKATKAYVDALASAVLAGFQPLDSDLSVIALLATTAFGRSLLEVADAAALRAAAALGTLATQSGTFSGSSSGTNTGDQTTVSGNAGSATVLQTARAIGGINFDGSAAIGSPFTWIIPWPGAALTTAGGKTTIIGSINTATVGQSLSRNVHFSRICLSFNCGSQVGTPQFKVILFKINQSAGNELIAVQSANCAATTGQGPLVSTSLLNGFAGALVAGVTFIITGELVGGTSATINSATVGLEGVHD